MSKRPLQASIAPDFLFKGRIDVHDTKSFLLAFIAPDFSENFLNKLETFSMRARHITGLAHNEKQKTLGPFHLGCTKEAGSWLQFNERNPPPSPSNTPLLIPDV